MEITCIVPRLVFPDGFNERDEWEMERKGFVYTFLECQDGCRHQVMFIDPVRLAQDIEATLQSGQPYYYEFGQVVVPEVTIPALTQIIPHLVEEGYLERHLSMRASSSQDAAIDRASLTVSPGLALSRSGEFGYNLTRSRAPSSHLPHTTLPMGRATESVSPGRPSPVSNRAWRSGSPR